MEDGFVVVEVRHLRLLRAIREEGSVTRASERLHLTQPAVSHALRDLEDRLGVLLFRRKGKKLAITEAGKRLLRTSTVVLDELQRAEDDLAQFRSGRRGVLRITTECYTCYHWLSGVLAELSRRYPGVDLEVVPDAKEAPFEALISERVDLAIVHREASHPLLVAAPLFQDELVVLVPRDHRLARKKFAVAADFADECLVMHSRPEESVFFTDVLRAGGVAPRRMLDLRLTEAVVEMVRAGLGVSVLARWAATGYLTRGDLQEVRIGRDGFWRTWFAATRGENDLSRPLADLVTLLRSAVPAGSEQRVEASS
jgi:LysR family transcriptional regulator for metE and metH